MSTTRPDLYLEVEANKLAAGYQRVVRAVEAQTEKLEQYPHSPFTRDSALVLAETMNALALLGAELRAWHEFIYPEPDAT